MNLMMNPSFTNEIAAQRIQGLIEAADRSRMRRWSRSSKSNRTVSPTPGGGLPLAASTMPTANDAGDVTSSATIAREPVTATKELADACARAA